MKIANLFADIADVSAAEQVNAILSDKHVRIERIVSHGHSSDAGFWYDQDEDELVVLIQGAARLQFEDKQEAVALKAGDYLHIPAHCRHRLAWTDPNEKSIWLALFFTADDET